MFFNLNCDNCGGLIYFDESATINAYSHDMDYKVDDTGKLVESLIQQYIVYTCGSCGESFRFTYKDWEKRMRLKLAYHVMNVKKAKMFAEDINPYDIDEANGLGYCGQCNGYGGDGDGWCLNDIIKQCTIRKGD